ncbi:GTP pyrophosphokinase [Posidoniimonas polymericola]|uniref:GTP pyrophosphokinase n=1 Tax=Posidoniimonas polymericola TaxID=2528002 RepID=A0A5C5ZF86_9BACT|nr:GTP pyrophosphokinase [Posidoniimonas polymericola]TWT85750.1 GTP pyrophosphokinase [Posidoniimonas polymericola]
MTSLVDLAEQIAVRSHAGQFRRDGVTPYVEHPRAVVARVGDSPNLIATAWLHDVLEDTDETRESLLAAGVPAEVVDAVELLTKSPGVAYEAYLSAILGNPIAREVKIADMLSNLADGPTPKQIRKYAAGLLRLVPAG